VNPFPLSIDAPRAAAPVGMAQRSQDAGGSGYSGSRVAVSRIHRPEVAFSSRKCHLLCSPKGHVNSGTALTANRQLVEETLLTQLRNHIFERGLLRFSERELRGDAGQVGLHQIGLRSGQLRLHGRNRAGRGIQASQRVVHGHPLRRTAATPPALR